MKSVPLPLLFAVLAVVGCQGDTDSTAAPRTPDQPAAVEPVTVSDEQPKADDTTDSNDTAPEVPVTIDINTRRPPKKLSDYGLFTDLPSLTTNRRVIPYEMNSLSYLDGARQQNFVYVPDGETISFRPEGTLEFPTGSVLIQNLWFPVDERDENDTDRLFETRLLVHKAKGWSAIPYLWNKDHSEADRVVIGEKTDLSWTKADGDVHSFRFITPNMNECKRCHVNEDVMYPIGVTAMNLNRSVEVNGESISQLQHWQNQGLLTGLPDDSTQIPALPDWTDKSAASVDRRARSWLDVNCSHCHNSQGAASTTGLDLTFEQNQPVRFGVYKPPVAAGRGSAGLKFSILPQKPDESFLIRRIASNEIGVMMPPQGRTTVDHRGVELIRQWITEMEVDEALAEAALNPMKAYQDAINGGDPKIGEEIFHKRQKCITCHTVGDKGGTVGPNLSDVGKRHKRDYLLESIVLPSAKIVKGYETQVLVLTDGRIVTGTVQLEDEYEVVIADAEKQTKVLKEDIDERESSDVSTMPTLANVLTVDDVRNLIAYLKTLQQSPQK